MCTNWQEASFWLAVANILIIAIAIFLTIKNIRMYRSLTAIKQSWKLMHGIANEAKTNS